MLARPLRWLAYACCLLTLASFTLFAVDQLSGASKSTSAAASGYTNDPAYSAARLTAPFRGIFPTSSQWVVQGGSTLLALVVYGAGLGFIARYSAGIGSRE